MGEAEGSRSMNPANKSAFILAYIMPSDRYIPDMKRKAVQT